MNPEELPILGAVFRSGAQDYVFDVLILLGPLLIVGISIIGRTTFTTVLAGLYIGIFILYVVYKGSQRRE